MSELFDKNWAFYDELRRYYLTNKGIIRRNYKQITRKILDYNDRSVNPNAFLRPPQFEAFEMYVFMKEFMGNKAMYQVFDEWRKREGVFADKTIYRRGQATLFDESIVDQTKKLFRQMKDVSENYPNYVFGLTMGLGKTILMATCIFYEFLLANKFPKDDRFCHNALVFAPDKTVLQSLKEIPTFDKSLVMPSEYVSVIDQNLRIHFLEDTGTTLHTLDDSDFNLVISNDQKIITKRKHSAPSSAERLFSMASGSSLLSDVYGDVEDLGLAGDGDLIVNQRFAKLCRLKQIGVYVDEAHHLFGKALSDSFADRNKENGLRRTINMLNEALEDRGSRVVACYNFTGTPYVKNRVLPDVLYAYGLKESINMGYLKRARVLSYENVKNEAFLRSVITEFWKTYGENKVEGLLPKLAIFAATIEEVQTEVVPIVERVLADLGIDGTKLLVNTGNSKLTRQEDIHIFNNLDNPNAGGNDKQFIVLVGKGREGWNCRSLFSVALFRKPKSTIFVLQATMRCLRQIGDTQQRATVFLSLENAKILDDELNKNFNMSSGDLDDGTPERRRYRVRMVPPERKVKLSRIRRTYSLHKREASGQIDFGLDGFDTSKYVEHVYEKQNITWDMTAKESSIAVETEARPFSEVMLVGELAHRLGPEVSCLTIEELLESSVDGIDKILSYVSRYEQLIDDLLVPSIFSHLYSVEYSQTVEPIEMSLLKNPKNSEYYEFSAKPDLVAHSDDAEFEGFAGKSFHADTYCFDSKPEKELFYQYIYCEDIQEVFFTGMFTGGQSEFAIQYIDPDSYRIRSYYPDFYVKRENGGIELIEVKGDNMIDDRTVIAKAEAAKDIATASRIEYAVIAGNYIMGHNVAEMDASAAQRKSIAAARGIDDTQTLLD